MKYLLVVFLFLFSTAKAQEKPIPISGSESYGIHKCDSLQNANSIDNRFAILPSPERRTGSYKLFFDLGREFTDKDTVSIGVYGIIPNASNLLVCQVWSEGGGNLNHYNVIGEIAGTSSGDLTSFVEPKYKHYVVQSTYEHPYSIIALFREATCSSIPYGASYLPYCDFQNGMNDLIDAVTVIQFHSVTKRNHSWSYHYGGFVINKSLFGKTLTRDVK